MNPREFFIIVLTVFLSISVYGYSQAVKKTGHYGPDFFLLSALVNYVDSPDINLGNKHHGSLLMRSMPEIPDFNPSSEKTITYLLIGVSILNLVLAIYMYGRSRKNKSLVDSLRAKIKAINNKKEQLEYSLKISNEFNNQLVESNKIDGSIFSLVSHNLISPYNTLLGFSKLLSENFDKYPDQEKKRFVDIINKSAQQNYCLIKNLLNWSETFHERLESNEGFSKGKKTEHNIVFPYYIKNNKKSVFIKLDLKRDLILLANNSLMPDIISNLINNLITCKDDDCVVNITCKKENQNLTIEIEDNGLMTNSQLRSLFNIKYRFPFLNHKKATIRKSLN